MTLHEKDLQLILDYVDGRLTEQQMLAAEIRFANEPELAEEYESFDMADEIQRQVLLEKARRGPFRLLRGGSPAGPIAAAALLLLAAGLFLTRESKSRLSTEFALVPSGIEWADFNRALELGDEWSERTPARMRGEGEQEFPHREYFDLANPIQEERLERALARPADPGPMVYFNVALRPEADCSVLVLISDAKGQVLDEDGDLYAPAYPGRTPWTADSGRLEGGRLEVLPRRNLVWNESTGEIEPYAPGFLVPPQAEHLQVLIGIREAPLNAELHGSLDTVLETLARGPLSPRTTTESLLSWMEDNGFEVIATSVEEAQD